MNVSSSVGLPISLRGIFEEAGKQIQERMRKTNRILMALEQDAQDGNLSPQTIASIFIQEIRARMNEDTALFEMMQSLAGNIDTLYDRIEAHERKVIHPPVSDTKELRIVAIASRTEERLSEGQT